MKTRSTFYFIKMCSYMVGKQTNFTNVLSLELDLDLMYSWRSLLELFFYFNGNVHRLIQIATGSNFFSIDKHFNNLIISFIVLIYILTFSSNYRSIFFIVLFHTFALLFRSLQFVEEFSNKMLPMRSLISFHLGIEWFLLLILITKDSTMLVHNPQCKDMKFYLSISVIVVMIKYGIN